MSSIIHVIGAGGRSGLALCRALLDKGYTVVPVVRDLGRYETAIERSGLLRQVLAQKRGGQLQPPRLADLENLPTLRKALGDAATVVNTAHARHIPALLAATREATRLVCLGSTRKFTRWLDAHGRGVLLGEQALLRSGRPGVILHPTMIYGAEGENNVQRLASILRRLPVIPLPGGGRSLVQPIHQSDVTASLVASVQRAWTAPAAVVIAGPYPVSYKEFVRFVSVAAGLRRRPVISLPETLLHTVLPLARLVPGVPRVSGAELRRLTEDKAFDITEMRSLLGVTPIALPVGLAALFGNGPQSFA